MADPERNNPIWACLQSLEIEMKKILTFVALCCFVTVISTTHVGCGGTSKKAKDELNSQGGKKTDDESMKAKMKAMEEGQGDPKKHKGN